MPSKHAGLGSGHRAPSAEGATKFRQSVQLGREYGAMPYRTFLSSSVSQHSNRRLQRCAAVTLSSGRAHKQETDEPMEGHQGATGPMLRSIRCFCRLAESFHTGCGAARDCRGLDHLQLVMAHFHLIISVELGKPGKTHNSGESSRFFWRYNGESLPVPCTRINDPDGDLQIKLHLHSVCREEMPEGATHQRHLVHWHSIAVS